MISYVLLDDDRKNNCCEYIQSLPDNKYEVVIKRKRRSGQQNKYYWVVTQILAQSLGYNSDELHEAFKRHFLGAERGKDVFGNVFIKAKSSAKLNKDEFIEYLNKVLLFAESNNIKIASPSYFGLNFIEE